MQHSWKRVANTLFLAGLFTFRSYPEPRSVWAPSVGAWNNFLCLLLPNKCSFHLIISFRIQINTSCLSALLLISSLLSYASSAIYSGSWHWTLFFWCIFFWAVSLLVSTLCYASTRNHTLRLATWHFDSFLLLETFFTFTLGKTKKHQLRFVPRINKTKDSGGSLVVAWGSRFSRFNGTLSAGRWID